MVQSDSHPKKFLTPLGADPNHAVYAAPHIVDRYRRQSALLPAEAKVLGRFAAALPGWTILDLGIGAGRTTMHLFGKCADYIGVDYSATMVEVCRHRFPAAPAQALQVGDARSLVFSDRTFDFVLFSYNGLDYIPHGQRGDALREIARVGKMDSWFLFSSHNLMSLGVRAGIGFFRRLAIGAVMRLANGSFAKLRQGDHAEIRDDGCGFRLKTHYIRPEAQLRDLADAGFGQITILDSMGQEISVAEASRGMDPFLHYLCRNGIR